jgi:hypothetical protein
MYNKLGLWWSVCHSQRLHIDNKLDYYYYYYYAVAWHFLFSNEA